MKLQEVQGVLKGISDTPKDKLKAAEIRSRLEECVWVLRSETMAQPIPPDDPILSAEISEARDSLERALNEVGENDVPAMLQHVQNASAELSKLKAPPEKVPDSRKSEMQ